MSVSGKALWACGAAAALCFVALAVLSKTQIEPAGMLIFDSRLAGYDLAQAQALVAALSPAQLGTYLGTFRVLDTVFPVLLAVSLAGGIWLNTSAETRLMRLAAVLGPMLYLTFDLLENAKVAQILRQGAQAQSHLVETAATFTQAKWMVLALSLLVMFWAWRFAAKRDAT